ncbi:uncharacterized protein N7498_004363 [Penicillium cinerascens]|uniref:chitinase n=1 Tax=Penicillium cinerascens TaxID=70096 RepID=A0A9W9T7S8_9EURO|nr:uncharacterized protein N7498_004363 [Penicillium cinerascens]KAJ5212717.1 hypothetical protein N7498_004363 [Penicillium cinerascens]
MQPENIPAGALTHINLGFVQFRDDWKMVDEYGDIVTRVSRLKTSYPGLRVNVAIGGWNFNDPPLTYCFSTMKYDLDDIELDWEYHSTEDRGGSLDDTDTFVVLLSELRGAFDATNSGWEITCTLPASYWYIQNFDLKSMEEYISLFNFMSYDLHGMWDRDNKNIGPYLRGHINLTEIDEGFNLLWRNIIDPKKGVMGMDFYGWSFTTSNKDCRTTECTFSTVGDAGPCSQTAGIPSGDVQTYYDPVSTVKYDVYNGNQWISYDDAQS